MPELRSPPVATKTQRNQKQKQKTNLWVNKLVWSRSSKSVNIDLEGLQCKKVPEGGTHSLKGRRLQSEENTKAGDQKVKIPVCHSFFPQTYPIMYPSLF